MARSARNAMAAAKQRRMSDFTGPSRSDGNRIRAAAAAGQRPQYAKGVSHAYRNAANKYIGGQRAAGKRINANEMHRKGTAGHTSAYAGAAASGRRAGEAGDRRSGADRRRG